MKKSLQDLVEKNQHILEDDGSIKRQGPHLDPFPKYYVKNEKGEDEMRVYIAPSSEFSFVMKPKPHTSSSSSTTPIPVSSSSTTSGPVYVSPPLPSDIGSTVDATGRPMWAQRIFSPSVELRGGDQGSLADCYFLSPLNGIADTAPWVLPSLCHKNPTTGTNDVVFRRGGKMTVIQMDNIVSAGSGCWDRDPSHPSGLFFLERAYAYLRTGANTYSSLGWGYAASTFSDFGISNVSLSVQSTDLLTLMQSCLLQERAIAVHTNSTILNAPLTSSHVYSVFSVDLNAGTVTFRNPWGVDGAGGDGSDDALVTMTRAQVAANCSAVVAVTGYPVTKPATLADANLDGVVDAKDYAVWQQWLGQSKSGPDFGDFDFSGVVDQTDYNIWAAASGMSSSSS